MTHFLMMARFIGVLAFVCLLLSGCSYEVLHYSAKNTRTYASNDASVSSIPVSGIHRVESGETLFSIAFRYGLDYRELAQANRIDSPYVIYPKQKIRLDAITPPAPKVVKKAIAPIPIPAPVVKEVPVKVVVPKPAVAIKAVKKPPENDTKDQKMSSGWSWPVDGTVTRGFSNAGVSSKGIDIKAAQGELVKAAADGTVVYAGSGLIGYGNLVIVKHDDVYLSAYAYNERILVKEKQNVKAGDSLAVIGGKGEERPLLHFEVRRDGQPIDPLDVLPKIK